jgi:hypothetical protein
MARIVNVPISDSCVAALYQARSYAKGIIDGSLTPYEGARRIWDDSFHDCFHFLNAGSDLISLLGAFVSHASDWEDHQERPDMTEELRVREERQRVTVEADIRACAVEYVALFEHARLPPERP